MVSSENGTSSSPVYSTVLDYKFTLMKKLLIIVFFFSATTGNAQVIISFLLGDKLNSDKVDFGLDGGLNWSTINGLPNANLLTGFNLGFFFDTKMKNPAWMWNTGVIVKSPMGTEGLPVYSLNDVALDSAFAGGSVTRKIRYFNVPLMVK